MAVNNPTTFRSDADIALLLTTAKYFGDTIPKDPVVTSVLAHFAADGLKNGNQIGTADILYHIVDNAITNLQKVDQAIRTIDPESEKTLTNTEEEYERERDNLLKALKEMQSISDTEKIEIIERLKKAPNTKEYLSNFPQPIAAIDKRTQALSEKAVKLLTIIEQTQQKHLDKYNRLFSSADEGVQKTVKLPGEIKEILSRHSRITSAQMSQDKPRPS